MLILIGRVNRALIPCFQIQKKALKSRLPLRESISLRPRGRGLQSSDVVVIVPISVVLYFQMLSSLTI